MKTVSQVGYFTMTVHSATLESSRTGDGQPTSAASGSYQKTSLSRYVNKRPNELLLQITFNGFIYFVKLDGFDKVQFEFDLWKR